MTGVEQTSLHTRGAKPKPRWKLPRWLLTAKIWNQHCLPQGCSWEEGIEVGLSLRSQTKSQVLLSPWLASDPWTVCSCLEKLAINRTFKLSRVCAWHTAAQQEFLGIAMWSWLVFSMSLLQHRNFKRDSCPLQTRGLGVLKLLLPLQRRVGMERVGTSPKGRNL